MNDRIKIARDQGRVLHAGLLVNITRASIGVPRGAIGLIIKVRGPSPWPHHGTRDSGNSITIYDVQLSGGPNAGKTVRRLSRDLEVINESR